MHGVTMKFIGFDYISFVNILCNTVIYQHKSIKYKTPFSLGWRIYRNTALM